MNRKGISSIVIILIIVGVLAIGGGAWYALNRTEPSKPPKLEKLAGLNPALKTFLDESAKKYPDLSIDKFTITESKGIDIVGEGFSKIDGSDDPVWTYSPDKTKAVSSLGYYGEPDSSLELYNRKGDKKIELLRTCGTPCSYRGEFWLDNKQFVFIQTHEYYPPNGEVRCAVDTKCTEIVSISLYNLEKNTETIYQSPELDKPIMLPSWPDRDLQIKAACEGLYGKDDPYCQQNDETASWKTYRNEKYGFEIKYPPQFIGLERIYGEAGSDTPNGIQFRSLESPGNPFTPYDFRAGKLIAASMDGPWIPDQCEISPTNELSGAEIVTTSENIATVMFTRIDIKYTNKNLQREIKYIGKYKDTCYRFLYTQYRDLGMIDEDSALFNQILSTFKFISQ